MTDAKRQSQRKYRENHREQLNEYQRKWRQENADKYKAQRERAWIKKILADVEKAEEIAKYENSL